MKEGIEKWDSEVQKEKVRYFLEKKSNVWWPLSLIFSFLLEGQNVAFLIGEVKEMNMKFL